MATITIRGVPEAIVVRIHELAAQRGRTVEEELRDLLAQRYVQRSVLLEGIRDRWSELPPTEAEEIDAWIKTGRS